MQMFRCLLITTSFFAACSTVAMADERETNRTRRSVADEVASDQQSDQASTHQDRTSASEISRDRDVLRRRSPAPPSRHPESLSINVTIAVSETETGKGKIVDELKLTTIDGGKAHLQFGQEVNVRSGTMQTNPMGAMMGGRGSKHNVYKTAAVGTVVQVAPKITSGGILLEVDVEKSWIEQPGTQDDSTSADGLPTTFNGSASSTIFVATGQNATFQAIVSGGTPNGRLMMITISATTGSQVAERIKNLRADVQMRDNDRMSKADDQSARSVDSSVPARESATDRNHGELDKMPRDAQEVELTESKTREKTKRNTTETRRSQESLNLRANFGALLFQRVDRNGNGQIDGDELTGVTSAIKDRFTGDSKNISKEEFVKQAGEYLQERIKSRGTQRD